MKNLAQQAALLFEECFESVPQNIFFSPGRINIIGEHVDYNDGFVLPAAINKYVCIAISQKSGTKCTIVASDISEKYDFDLTDTLVPVEKAWANYFLGVLQQLKDRELPITGFNLVFSSTIPIGSGLSSSAAVECGFAFALNEIFNLGIGKKDIALIGQKAEHTFVGVQCGIMDQFASVFGKKGQVIKLDCNTLEYEYHKADFKDYALLLLDSTVKHSLADSNYNIRRQEVDKALAIINKKFPGVATYRECREEHVNTVSEELGETLYRRSLFVVQEIQRVQDAVEALDQHDFEKLGQLMYATHRGLSEEYEVSCEETDFLVDAVRNDKKVLGSRMMGGGFGGCTINLVEKGYEDELIERVAQQYKDKFNIELKAYKVETSDGNL
jgi:galactokinase